MFGTECAFWRRERSSSWRGSDQSVVEEMEISGPSQFSGSSSSAGFMGFDELRGGEGGPCLTNFAGIWGAGLLMLVWWGRFLLYAEMVSTPIASRDGVTTGIWL